MPYREPRLALEERLRALEEERADLDARLADHDALHERARRVAADIEDLRSLLGPKASLPVLRIATPCNARWQDMDGDGRVRFCRSCEKNVYDLTAMSELEAAALLREHEGTLCGRIHVRHDGTALADDCPVGVRRRRRTVVAAAALAAMVPAAMAMTVMTKMGGMRVEPRARRMGPELEKTGERIARSAPEPEPVTEGRTMTGAVAPDARMYEQLRRTTNLDLQPGDRILAVDGKLSSDPETARNLYGRLRRGEPMVFTVLRGGKTITLRNQR